MMHTKTHEHISQDQEEFELTPGSRLFSLTINLSHSLYGSSRETHKS